MLLKRCKICDANGMRDGDIRIVGSKIVQVASDLKKEPNEEILDCNELVLMPAMIDMNVRVLDDILTQKNLIHTKHNALKGGVGHIILMPDSMPLIDNEAVIELVNTNAQIDGEINALALCHGVRADGSLSDVSILIKSGCVGIYAPSFLNGNILRRLFEYAQLWDVPIFCRCEDLTISGNGVMNEGHYSAKYGLPGIAGISETIEVAKICEIAIDKKVKVIFQALSSARSLQIIKNAKKEGASVYAEVSIHHLALTEKACEGFDTSAKIKPPLQSNQTRIKLNEALKNGDIDFLTSLHSPKSISKKDMAFEEASFGIDAIKDYFGLLYTNLVKNGLISLSELSKLTSLNQANLLKFNKGLIQEGYDADIMLVSLNSQRYIDDPFSPYKKSEIFGEVLFMAINGDIKLNRLL